ncbi:hypothetical protein OPT61_g995 [Boeremia exigua]|uniref:Uncharacterized protein n=1 Tax=Boeremia exigua TaxID=749465 RepID=A0ACC2IRT6_9PLEO|nr:hypothetical protein OPT61_g995 [Boeremia exigua]
MFQRIAFGGAYSTIPTVLLGIYPASILDGLAYGVSLLLYSSDILVVASSVPLSTEHDSIIKEADAYYANASKEVSSINELRRASDNDPSLLEKNVDKEISTIRDTSAELTFKLESAKLQAPSRADDFEERINLVKDASTEATNTFVIAYW